MPTSRSDERPLSTRIKVLADTAAAHAIGLRKQMGEIDARASNAEREAAWLREAWEALKKVGQ